MAEPGVKDAELPLQVFTTAAALLELIDKRIIVTMRDGRALFGFLRSFDTFGNIVIQDTYERLYTEGAYAEKYRGVWVIRGENVAMIGEVDQSAQEELDQGSSSLEKVEFEVLEHQLIEEQEKSKKQFQITREKGLKLGLDPASVGSIPHLF